MSLRHALLAVLTAAPMSGYDLVKYFNGTVAFVWNAPPSQIYPELRRMAEEGLLDVEVVARGQRASKRLYSISENGLEELNRWANDVLPLQPTRDPYRLKAAYMEWADIREARRQLEEHEHHYEYWLAQWRRLVDDIRARRVPLLRRRLEGRTEREQDEIVAFKLFAFEGEIAHAEAEIAWARRGLGLLDEIETARESPRQADRAS
ncbi:MAG: PadR family transcriptional regulator [Streptosporangiales bacterium]|nr:PadR family transcriptional regulator [Streptosporangiales bacterium]